MWPSFPGFHLKRRIGHGACGEVYEAIDANEQGCALKVLDPEAINAYYVDYCYGPHGPLATQDAQHQWPPTLARVLAYRAAEHRQSSFYALPLWADWLPQHNTWRPRLVRHFANQTAHATVWKWVEDIAAAVAFLHRHQVVHGSIKPSNVFLSSPVSPDESATALPRAVLSDWGQGWLGGATALPLSDHVFFAPPEQLRHPGDIEDGAGQRWDIYALGATAYTLLTSHFPRGNHFAKQWLEPLQNGELPDPTTFADIIAQESRVHWPTPASDAQEQAQRDVVERCLSLDPAARFANGEEVVAALAEASRPQRALSPSPVADAPAVKNEIPAPSSSQAPQRARTWRRPAAAGVIAGATLGAAICSGGWHFAHRELRREQESRAELERELASRTTDDEARLADTTSSLGTAQDALRRLSFEHEQLETHFGLLFDKFLEAAQHVPSTREQTRLLELGRSQLLEFISQNEKRPELSAARLRSLVSVGKIDAILNPSAAVERFAFAREEIETFLTSSASTLSPAQRKEFQLLEADSVLAEARTRFAYGQSHTLDASSLERSLAFLESTAPPDERAPELIRRLAETRVWQAQSALSAVSPPNGASVVKLQSALDDLRLLLTETEVALPTDKLLLGRGLLLRGRLERRRGQFESALATQVETAQNLLEAVESPEALDALAQCYGETAEMLAQNGERLDAVRAFSESIKLLTDLITAHPKRQDWRFQLSTRYAGLAQVLREHGEPNRALEYQQGAVRLVQALADAEPTNSPLTAARALREAELAELQFTIGQRKEVVSETQTIRQQLEGLELPPAERSFSDWLSRIHVARSYEITGRLCEELKKTTEARDCYAKASLHYEVAASAAPSDETIGRGLTDVKAKLAKLMP